MSHAQDLVFECDLAYEPVWDVHAPVSHIHLHAEGTEPTLPKAYATKAHFPYCQLLPELQVQVNSYLTKKDLAMLSSTSSSMRADLMAKALGTICIAGTVSEVLREIQDFNDMPHIVKVARSLKIALHPEDFASMDLPICAPRQRTYFKRHGLGTHLGYALTSMAPFIEELILSISCADHMSSIECLVRSLVYATPCLCFKKMKTLRLRLGDGRAGSRLGEYLISRCPSTKTLFWWDTANYDNKLIRINGPFRSDTLTSFTLGNTKMTYKSTFIRTILLAFPQLERFAMFGSIHDDTVNELAHDVHNGILEFGRCLKMLSIPLLCFENHAPEWARIAGFFLRSLPTLEQIQLTPWRIFDIDHLLVARNAKVQIGSSDRWPFNSFKLPTGGSLAEDDANWKPISDITIETDLFHNDGDDGDDGEDGDDGDN
ncbi:unnamed protein product [Colletotrichum noveboracense]|uniref:Uncharacterized protein n=1 Tax=Colletotrichum noveboracense TaxID=2664923 RepID=A0A9W4WB70_9PEZI|nr:unnamed protein product [Colletotrichum noveboracense]